MKRLVISAVLSVAVLWHTGGGQHALGQGGETFRTPSEISLDCGTKEIPVRPCEPAGPRLRRGGLEGESAGALFVGLHRPEDETIGERFKNEFEMAFFIGTVAVLAIALGYLASIRI